MSECLWGDRGAHACNKRHDVVTSPSVPGLGVHELSASQSAPVFREAFPCSFWCPGKLPVLWLQNLVTTSGRQLKQKQTSPDVNNDGSTPSFPVPVGIRTAKTRVFCRSGPVRGDTEFGHWIWNGIPGTDCVADIPVCI